MADEATIRIVVDGLGSAGGGGGSRGGKTDWVASGMGQADEYRMRVEAINRLFATAFSTAEMTRKMAEAQSSTMHSMTAGMSFNESPVFSMTKEWEEHHRKLAELDKSADPGVVEQRVRMEKELTAAREKSTAAMEKERGVVEGWAGLSKMGADNMAAIDATRKMIEGMAQVAEPVEVMIDLEKEAENFAKAMGDLKAAMDPEVVRKRVQQELELEHARQQLSKATEEERERQVPTLEEAGEKQPGFLGQLLGFGKKIRGSLGGMFGKTVGGGLDVAEALGGKGGGAGGSEAAAGAEGAGGMMAAAGPVGAVLAVAKLQDELNKKVGQAIEGFGQFTASMVSANESPTNFMASVAGMAKSIGDSIPIIGGFISHLGSAGIALAAVTREIEGLADRYAEFNPDIAMAQGIADIRQQLGDFRRGQEAAPDLIQFIQQRAELQQKVEDAKIRILNKIMPAILTGMEYFERLLPIIEALFGLVGELARILPGGQDVGNQRLNDIRSLLDALNQPAAAQLPTNIVRQGYPFAHNAEGGVRGTVGANTPQGGA